MVPRSSGTLFGVTDTINTIAATIAAIVAIPRRGYNGGGMVNYGKVVFRGEVMVRDNSAVMDGGGFINE